MKLETICRPLLICIAFLLTLFLWKIIAAIFIIGYAYRLFVKLLLNQKYGNSAELMNGVDAVWAEENPRWRSIITSMMILEGKPDINEFRTRVSKLRNSENRKLFQSRHWGRGYYFWKDIPRYIFKMEEHVRSAPIKEATEEELSVFLSSISTTPLGEKENTAGWEVIVGPEIINTNEPHIKRCALIIRCHHSIGYGNALLKLLDSLADNKLEFRGMSKPMEFTWYDTFQTIVKIIASTIYGPYCVLDQVLRYDSNALYGPQLSGSRTLVWAKVGTIDTCRKIRNHTGCNVNDAIISSVSSSMSTLLQPSDSFVTAIIPVSVILPGLKTPVPRKGEEYVLLNRVSAGLLKIPTPPPSTDPITRLKQVHESCNVLRSDPALLVNYFLASRVWTVLPSPIAKLMLSVTRYTLILSNLPGPDKSVSLCGQKVQDLIFWLPCRCTTGVGVALLSYDQVIRVGVSVDTAILPLKSDVKLLAQGIAKQLEKLVECSTT